MNCLFSHFNENPPDTKRVLDEVGDDTITNMKIARCPVSSFKSQLIKKFTDLSRYDILYHTYLIIETDKKNILKMEKNCMLVLSYDIEKTLEYMEILNIPTNLTINLLLKNAERKIGRDKILKYTINDNNCQHFILNILKANNIEFSIYMNFIKQDVDDMFGSNIITKKLINNIVYMKNSFDVLLQKKDSVYIILTIIISMIMILIFIKYSNKI
jgi:hypothetical protein